MEKVFALMVMLASCSAYTRDLSGEVFVFPGATKSDHVKLITPKTYFSALTICFRFVTDLPRNYSLFSLATPKVYNDFLIFKSKENVISVYVHNAHADFFSIAFLPNTWHTFCATWESEKGIAQLWIDEEPTVKKFVHSGQPISGRPSIVLGQEQDKYGGGFDVSQSFIGEISQLHMWDYVILPHEIRRYTEGNNFAPGNVFNWRNLNFEIVGGSFVEKEVQ
nr:serum amyloid P-component-like [Nerophis lumbriciformis]